MYQDLLQMCALADNGKQRYDDTITHIELLARPEIEQLKDLISLYIELLTERNIKLPQISLGTLTSCRQTARHLSNLMSDVMKKDRQDREDGAMAEPPAKNKRKKQNLMKNEQGTKKQKLSENKQETKKQKQLKNKQGTKKQNQLVNEQETKKQKQLKNKRGTKKQNQLVNEQETKKQKQLKNKRGTKKQNQLVNEQETKKQKQLKNKRGTKKQNQLVNEQETKKQKQSKNKQVTKEQNQLANEAETKQQNQLEKKQETVKHREPLLRKTKSTICKQKTVSVQSPILDILDCGNFDNQDEPNDDSFVGNHFPMGKIFFAHEENDGFRAMCGTYEKVFGEIEGVKRLLVNSDTSLNSDTYNYLDKDDEGNAAFLERRVGGQLTCVGMTDDQIKAYFQYASLLYYVSIFAT